MKKIDAKSRDPKTINRMVKEAIDQQEVMVKNAEGQNGLMNGFTGGKITIRSDTGHFLGVFNNGAFIRVTHNTGKYPADSMTGGTIIIHGDAGDGAGQYAAGGILQINGNAGDEAGLMNDGATIVIKGSTGDRAGAWMRKGTLVVAGNAGLNLGEWMTGGSIYIGGKWTSLGQNVQSSGLTPEEIAGLRNLFSQMKIHTDPTGFHKITAIQKHKNIC